ncbi:MAG TPA: hypothetical protein VF867_09440 [Arthrobacter sp.]
MSAASIPARQGVRPLTVRERWVMVFVGFGAGPWLADLFPFFNGSAAELNDQGLLPAAVAFEVGSVLLGCAVFWLVSYALRLAALSPRAPKWLSRGMDPGPAS